jgi:hypothetical protein
VTEVDMRIWAQESVCEPSRISERTTASLRPTTASWERPDNGFADMVLATAAKGNAPDFGMPAGTGNDTGEVSVDRCGFFSLGPIADLMTFVSELNALGSPTGVQQL